MVDEATAQATTPTGVAASEPASDPADGAGADQGAATLEDLRTILLADQRERVAELERRLDDDEALIARISPVMGSVIRRTIREARDEMVDALHPVIGATIARAVAEAMRELARSVDARVQASFSPRAFRWRLRALVAGVSRDDLALRGILPFEVSEIFLIHRETGLVLRHMSREPDQNHDSDVISGMLTAVRDFVQDAFARGEASDFEVIQHGRQRILVEAATEIYVAAVIDGIEPSGYAGLMRERLLEVERAYDEPLRSFDGDASCMVGADEILSPLLSGYDPDDLGPRQLRVAVATLLAVAAICVGATFVGARMWQARSAATAPGVASLPSGIDPGTVVAVARSDARLRQQPSGTSRRLDTTLAGGQLVEIVALEGTWFRVRTVDNDGNPVAGWVSVDALGPAVPASIVTPLALPTDSGQ